jgi:very-short-patch-repair endonuclease
VTTEAQRIIRAAERTRLEDELAGQLRLLRVTGIARMEREYQFDPSRRWRFDLAFPLLMLAVEVEGGTWSGGRHTRATGFRLDCDKYNEAALQGWLVLRVTADKVHDGSAARLVERAVRERLGT